MNCHFGVINVIFVKPIIFFEISNFLIFQLFCWIELQLSDSRFFSISLSIGSSGYTCLQQIQYEPGAFGRWFTSTDVLCKVNYTLMCIFEYSNCSFFSHGVLKLPYFRENWRFGYMFRILKNRDGTSIYLT